MAEETHEMTADEQVVVSNIEQMMAEGREKDLQLILGMEKAMKQGCYWCTSVSINEQITGGAEANVEALKRLEAFNDVSITPLADGAFLKKFRDPRLAGDICARIYKGLPRLENISKAWATRRESEILRLKKAIDHETKPLDGLVGFASTNKERYVTVNGVNSPAFRLDQVDFFGALAAAGYSVEYQTAEGEVKRIPVKTLIDNKQVTAFMAHLRAAPSGNAVLVTVRRPGA